MSPFFATLQAIKNDASLPRPAARGRVFRLFTDAGTRIPALARYETPAAVLGALSSKSRLEYAERHELITALVAENQRAADPLWQSLLLGAFESMLLRLRGRVGFPRSPDHDQRLLLAFLNAVRSVRVGSYTVLAIRWATEGEIFSSLRADRRRPDRAGPGTAEYNDDTHPADVFGIDEQDRAAALEIVRIVEGHGGDELLDVVLATKASDESLRDYVARKHPRATDAARATEYRRLLRARDRLMTRLERRVTRTRSPLSPIRISAA